jgi:hypothetical protein
MRLIGLPIPEIQRENPRYVCKGLLLTLPPFANGRLSGSPVEQLSAAIPLLGQIHLPQERLVARIAVEVAKQWVAFDKPEIDVLLGVGPVQP